jgi:hypothetical protein
MPAAGASGRFNGIARGDASIGMTRRVASGALAPMGRSYSAGRSVRPIASR